MRVYLLLRDRKEEGPMSIEDVRDRLDLRMIGPDQPCRIAGLEGTYVAGELVTGHLFKGWEPEEDAAEEELDEEEETNGDEDEEDDETETDDEDEIEDDDEDEEIDGDEDEWDDVPLWEGKPGYTAFLPRVGITTLFFVAFAASFFFAWPMWISMVLAAFACLSLALLLGRRAGTRYSIYERRLQWTTPGFLRRERELPRAEVDAIDIKRPFPGSLLGRADIHFHHQHPNLPNPIIFRQVARAREARALWR